MMLCARRNVSRRTKRVAYSLSSSSQKGSWSQGMLSSFSSAALLTEAVALEVGVSVEVRVNWVTVDAAGDEDGFAAVAVAGMVTAGIPVVGTGGAWTALPTQRTSPM